MNDQFRKLDCFNKYDLRGIVDKTIDSDVAYRVGYAFGRVLKCNNVVVGYDVRESSLEFANALSDGIRNSGSNVLWLGLSGTEEVYFGVSEFGADGGICITASHNPINYNGMKFIGGNSRPLDSEGEFFEIQKVAQSGNFLKTRLLGEKKDVVKIAREAYVEKVISFVELKNTRPLRVVVNCGNGAAGPAYTQLKDAVASKFPNFNFIDMFVEPDSTFPNGIPNPLLEENRKPTRDAIIINDADLGVAFDGDFDRCFFFDETGTFISGEYIISLISSIFLNKEPKSAIIHDPRVVLNIRDIISNKGGRAIQTKTGHAFVKKAMREENAIYGGELSAHHYFRDFAYCDSGLVPFLLILELMGKERKKLSSLVKSMKRKFPSSGEISFIIDEKEKAIDEISALYSPSAIGSDTEDGLSLEFPEWRFNLRQSNTEPVVRLNVETKGNKKLLGAKTREIVQILEKFSHK